MTTSHSEKSPPTKTLDNVHAWKLRAELKAAIRRFFEKRGYFELDTPIGVMAPGTEVHLRYFDSQWFDFKGRPHKIYLRSSPELHMKRALAEGCERIFQLAPCFRNGGEFSEWHQPEFTMLEWYGMGQSYHGLIDETEELLRTTAEDMASKTGVRPEILLPKKIRRIGVTEAFAEFCGITLQDQDPDLAKKCIAAGIVSVQATDDFETAYFKTLIERIEPALVSMQGAVLMDYPPSQAALAVVENGVASRFEFYLGRVEICNGFFELTGADNNRRRVRESLQERARHGLPPVPEDEAFYKAMDKIQGPCAGNALGFDRWLALLCGQSSLDAVIPFRRSTPWAT